MLLTKKPMLEPDTKWVYSNLGYALIGVMAERTTKATWEDLMRKRMFNRLGMTTAGFGPAGTKGKIDQPLGHKEDGTPVEPGPDADNLPWLSPAVTIHCSLPDWSKFIADQLRGGRGGKALLKADAYKTLHASPAKDQFYTPGARARQQSELGVMLMHDGSNSLNYAAAAVFPAADIAVLAVTNQGGPAATKACHEAMTVLLKKYAKPPAKGAGGGS